MTTDNDPLKKLNKEDLERSLLEYVKSLSLVLKQYDTALRALRTPIKELTERLNIQNDEFRTKLNRYLM